MIQGGSLGCQNGVFEMKRLMIAACVCALMFAVEGKADACPFKIFSCGSRCVKFEKPSCGKCEIVADKPGKVEKVEYQDKAGDKKIVPAVETVIIQSQPSCQNGSCQQPKRRSFFGFGR